MQLRLLRRLHLSRSRPFQFVKKYTSKEIEKATNGFSMIIETGPDGTTYKGRFANGLLCSLKKAKWTELDKNKDSFLKEVQLLGILHHINVVRLLGFSDGDNRFLVFEHMENGSLRDCLHDPLRTPLIWRIRLKIAIDVAAALEYLYYFCEPPLFNASVNSKTIMLDSNYNAKLSDVGLLPSNEPNATFSQEEIEQRRNELIFQFGIMILELVTGQSLSDESELVRWVQMSNFAGTMHKMVDADLGNNYDSKELHSLLVVARLCTKNGNERFVSIPQIHRYLQKSLDSSIY